MDYIPVTQFKTLAGIKKSDTVTDALKELEELGLIISIKRQGQVTGYRLNMPEPTPENGGTTTPENGVHPKNGTTPENGGYPPPKIGGTTTPENGGSSKHTTKPTNTKHNIHASAAADATVPAEPELYSLFEPATEMTASEIHNRATEPAQLGKVLAYIADNPLYDKRRSGSVPPPPKRQEQQTGQPQPQDDIDDDLPF